MDKFAPVIESLDKLLTHFNRQENKATDIDFSQLRYIENQVNFLRKLMMM